MKNLNNKIRKFLEEFLAWCKDVGKLGQSAVEYLLIFAGVVIVVVAATNPQGFLTKTLNKSLTLAIDGITTIADKQCLGPGDNVNGGWTTWSGWSPCKDCSQFRTRTCTNPPQACSGSDCSGGAAAGFDSRACSGSGTWSVSGSQSCSVTCTGVCGSTTGTCQLTVVCSGGCCDPLTKPSDTQSCTKLAYPGGAYTYSLWGACNLACGAGIETRTEVCADPGGCCDPSTQQPTVKACAQGCCAVVEPDITSNGDGIPGSFPQTASGLSATVSCPSGYIANPQNPTKSCVGAVWGPMVGICDPKSCVATSVFGGPINVTLGPAPHGPATVSVNCSDFNAIYTGTVSGVCDYGTWINVTGTCTPKPCPAGNLDIGSGQTYYFPQRTSGWFQAACPAGYTGDISSCPAGNSTGNIVGAYWYIGVPRRECIASVWQPTENACVPAVCPPMTLSIGSGLAAGYTGVFPATNSGGSGTAGCPAPAPGVPVWQSGNATRACDGLNWLTLTNPCICQSVYSTCCTWYFDPTYGTLAPSC